MWPQVSNTSWVSTWYQLTRFDAVSDNQTLGSAEVGRGICFLTMCFALYLK